MYELFLKYWKLSTWFVKPIGPYYRWLWRNPGKKFFILLAVNVVSVTIQFKLLDKYLSKIHTRKAEREFKEERKIRSVA